MSSTKWGDNWQVDGITEFEDQRILCHDGTDIKTDMARTDVVPFLIPGSGSDKVIIGDRDRDSVSELSEAGSADYMSDDSDDDEVIDAVPVTDVIVAEIEDNNTPTVTGLRMVSAPRDTTVTRGKTLKMTCVLEGEKPIGK